MKAFKEVVHRTRPGLKTITAANRNYSLQRREDNIVKSSVPHVPLPNLSLDEYLLHKVERWSDKTALECAETGRCYTFSQTQKYAERLSQALCAKFGYRKGDKVAIMVPNVPEFMIAALGMMRAGIIINTLNPVYTEDEIARQLKDSEAKAVITLTANYKTVQNAISQMRSNVKIPIITIKHQKTDTTPEGAIDFKELIEYSGPDVTIDKPSMEDLALLAYSSGTSGMPKGVQLVHRNISSNVFQVQQDSFRITEETTNSHQDVAPIIAPVFHCYGMIPILFNVFSAGCKSVMLPKYTPVTFLNMLEKYPCNIMHLVPPIAIMMSTNEAAKRQHVRNTRYIVSAAAPFAASDIEIFKKKFGDHFSVLQYYGLTETGPVTHAARLDKPVIPGSCGYTLHLTECRVVAVDDESKNLPPNQDGHLLIRGDGVMKGYFNNPKATAEALDKEGWFRTGDVAHYDEEGAFFITDRIKELIKVKGFQVAPAELEALIREHPSVADAAVTSVPHAQHGEAPKAFVVPRKDSNLRPEQVQQYVKEKAAKYKQLTGGVVFVDAIPKNPSGKILRRLLKDL